MNNFFDDYYRCGSNVSQLDDGACKWLKVQPPTTMPNLVPYLKKFTKFPPSKLTISKDGTFIPIWMNNY